MSSTAQISPQRISFETAAQHATRHVPVFAPVQRVDETCTALMQQHYERASHIVICSDQHFLGLLRIEDLLGAPADVTLDTLMDCDAPRVAPGWIRKLPPGVPFAIKSRHSPSSTPTVG